MAGILPDETMDLSGVGCPQNSARTLLKLEVMDAGEILEIIIDDGEPIKYVPSSLAEEGHEIISTERDGEKWRLLIRRSKE